MLLCPYGTLLSLPPTSLDFAIRIRANGAPLPLSLLSFRIGFCEGFSLMVGTQAVALPHQVYSKDVLVKLLPQSFLAAAVEVHAETLVLEQLSEVVFAQFPPELHQRSVVRHVIFDGVDDVEDGVGAFDLESG
jgi:hypothetical protein